MPMGMPYPKGDMAMGGGKPSMSELMGVEKPGGPMPPMPPAKGKKPMPPAKGKGKKAMPFKKK